MSAGSLLNGSDPTRPSWAMYERKYRYQATWRSLEPTVLFCCFGLLRSAGYGRVRVTGALMEISPEVSNCNLNSST